jgi:predicted HAD superfamily phosphohydrolase YqeG
MNIQRINYNKHINRQKAYENIIKCIADLATVNSLLDIDNTVINKQYAKANKHRRQKLDQAMEINNGIIIANSNRIKKLLKEKHILGERGCR